MFERIRETASSFFRVFLLASSIGDEKNIRPATEYSESFKASCSAQFSPFSIDSKWNDFSICSWIEDVQVSLLKLGFPCIVSTGCSD